MNKLTKVGCSALCGSLAAISAANAGDLTVTGGADLTWVSLTKDVTGNPIGMGSNFSMKGSGELDNGWTFDLTIAHTNGGAYSSTALAVGMGGFGKLNINSGDSGNGIQKYDDVLPTAWEEAHGAGMSTGVRGIVSGLGASSNIQYTTPTFAGTTIDVAYAHRMGDVDNADKTGGGVSHTQGVSQGLDVTMKINASLGTEILSGLNLYVGGHEAQVYNNHSLENNAYQAVAAIVYDIGPFSIGQQWSGEYSGEDNSTQAFNVYKNHAYGIAFNVNDDLSVSYGSMRSYKAGYTNSNLGSQAEGREIHVRSAQVAYTLGGASVRVAQVEADNSFFSSATSADKSATIVSLGLAF
jgi:hypothetical protein